MRVKWVTRFFFNSPKGKCCDFDARRKLGQWRLFAYTLLDVFENAAVTALAFADLPEVLFDPMTKQPPYQLSCRARECENE